MTTDHSPSTGEDSPPLALIAGPTASGKSQCAVNLAKRIEQAGRKAVIINADSAQIYRDLAVLSARPSHAEMQGINHRLFGEWDGAQACSAADWAEAARREVAEAHAAGAVPILVGGTGLYLRTLLDGIAPVPPIDPAVRAHTRSLAVKDAYAALCREDPPRAARLAPADAARIARALEVVRSTGRTLDEWQLERSGGIASAVSLHPLILLPPREKLYRRCDLRFAGMLGSGAVGEVEALVSRNLDPDLPVMRAIGVSEISGLLRGELSRDEVLARGAQATRNYAKRQYTWFRHQPPANWPREEALIADPHDHFEILLQQ